jgi:hypothetical protein
MSTKAMITIAFLVCCAGAVAGVCLGFWKGFTPEYGFTAFLSAVGAFILIAASWELRS